MNPREHRGLRGAGVARAPAIGLGAAISGPAPGSGGNTESQHVPVVKLPVPDPGSEVSDKP